MKVRVVAVGRISPILKELQNHYLRKLRNVEVIEVKKQRTKEKEGETLLEKAKGYTIVLDERGIEMTSRKFASIFPKHSLITFLIGGADGISTRVKEESNKVISLSKMTLQHDIARIVLLEQLYRADQIIKRTPYHRD